MKIKHVFFAVAITLFAFSCSDDDSKPRGKYELGVLIANEGGFGKGTASVTYYNPTTEEAEQNIFIKPPLLFAGDLLQSISFSGDRAYLVLNGSNKIEIVNAGNFELISTLSGEDIFSPRYLEVINNKAYISVWGPYDANFSLVDSYVLVVDLATNTVLKKIDTDEGSENMVVHNNRLFVANYNYGSSNTVAVINPSDNSLIDQVEVGAGPAGMVIDKNNKLWVLCRGSFSGAPAQLVRINPTSLAIEEEIVLTSSPGKDLALTPDKGTLVYRSGKSVYTISIEAIEEPDQALFTASDIVSPYALNVDPSNGDIWFGDAIGFASDGNAFVYSSTGVYKKTVAVGIAPTQFIFR